MLNRRNLKFKNRAIHWCTAYCSEANLWKMNFEKAGELSLMHEYYAALAEEYETSNLNTYCTRISISHVANNMQQ